MEASKIITILSQYVVIPNDTLKDMILCIAQKYPQRKRERMFQRYVIAVRDRCS